MGLVIRAAEPADLGAIEALERDCLGRDAWSRALIEAGLAGLPTVTYLVAEHDGVVVGHAVVSVADGVSELQRISVTESQRRTGTGSALLAAAIVQAVDSGAERMLLEVRVENEGARAFYRSHGFRELSIRARYYRDGAAAAVLERRWERAAPEGAQE